MREERKKESRICRESLATLCGIACDAGSTRKHIVYFTERKEAVLIVGTRQVERRGKERGGREERGPLVEARYRTRDPP
jgi:hypothetical protein